MSTHLTPEGFRTAAYLEARARMDARGKGPKCNPPNRACGDRCIPPNWKCRAEGEGTDSHSRVIAGDPLAGAASIARGRTRLIKGLKTGSLTDIQAGRAAIARGLVKVVPGKNLKEKQDLRKKVENVIIPVATGLFATWAIRQGHEAAKVLFPTYARGPAQDIERAAGSAIGFVFDRIPVIGSYRQAVRENASLQAQVLAQGQRFYTRRDPAVSGNNLETFTELSTERVSGLRKVINSSLNIRTESGVVTQSYAQFRSNVLSNVLGAQQDGKSIYAEPAAINLLSRQFGIQRSSITGADNTARKSFLINKIAANLTAASQSMRSDMEVRGLDYRKPADIDRYIEIAISNARSRFRGLTDDQASAALGGFGGIVRDLVGAKQGNPERRIANNFYNSAVDSYNEYFKQAARNVKEDTSPQLQVPVAAMRESPIRSTLIGVAERLKGKVKINGPIRGANHAELVLQRVYNEYAATGRFNPNRKATWMATDADIKYAAQDLGWNNQGGVTGAYDFLQRTGQFPNLARRPSDYKPPSRREQVKSLQQLITAIRSRPGNENMSVQAAMNEALRIQAERKK